MRTSGDDNEYVLPESPSKAHVAGPSHQYQYEEESEPVVQQAYHAPTPDDMLRHYAAGLAMSPAPPPPQASYNVNGMRNLYSPKSNQPYQLQQQRQRQHFNGGHSAGGHSTGGQTNY